MTMKPLMMATCALMLATAAHAQAPASPTNPPTQAAPPTALPPTNCAPMQPNGSGTKTDGTTVGESHEPLGDKLARSDGTLCPPSNVDPEIRAPARETGKMPVIPPPGSPGGDPSVRPK
jgi:hypothetical protein